MAYKTFEQRTNYQLQVLVHIKEMALDTSCVFSSASLSISSVDGSHSLSWWKKVPVSV